MANGLPNIPNLPAAVSFASLLTSDAKSIAGLLGFGGKKPKWGIFKGGKPVIAPDSVINVDYKNDYRIADYPMEEGSFNSYNKVNTPFDVKVRLTKSGNVAARAAFLKVVEGLAASLDLYDVVTPEKTYKSVNINHFDYRRTATQGMGMIVVDIWFTEIRLIVKTSLSSAKAPVLPSGADLLSIGNVQAVLPSAAQLAPALDAVVSPITEGLSAAITSATPAMASAVRELSSTLSSTLSSAVAGLTPAVEGAVTTLGDVLNTATPALQDTLAGAMENLSSTMSGLSSKLPQLTGAMQGIGQNITNALSLNLGGH